MTGPPSIEEVTEGIRPLGGGKVTALIRDGRCSARAFLAALMLACLVRDEAIRWERDE